MRPTSPATTAQPRPYISGRVPALVPVLLEASEEVFDDELVLLSVAVEFESVEDVLLAVTAAQSSVTTFSVVVMSATEHELVRHEVTLEMTAFMLLHEQE
jgi:hypothetical protein